MPDNDKMAVMKKREKRMLDMAKKNGAATRLKAMLLKKSGESKGKEIDLKEDHEGGKPYDATKETYPILRLSGKKVTDKFKEMELGEECDVMMTLRMTGKSEEGKEERCELAMKKMREA